MSPELKRLEEVCEIQPKKSEAKNILNDDANVSFMGMNMLGIDKMHATPKETKELSSVYKSYTYFRENDVLLAKITPCFENGKLGIAKNLENGVGFGSSEFTVYRCGSTLLPDYLYYFLKSDLFRLEGISSMSGAVGQKRVAKGYLTGASIPLPSLPVQKQIVKKLDAAFADIDKAINATRKNIKNAEALFQRNLFDIFEGEHATRKASTVGDIADHCLGKMLDKNKNKGALQPYLRNTNVQWFSVNTDDILLMKFEPKEEERFSVKKGDLLICEGGYPGRAAIWEKEEIIYFQKALHRVRCKERVYNKWLMYYLFYLSSNNKLAYYFTGSGIQHFTGKSLKKLSIPVPSIQDTSSYLRILDLLFDQLDSIKSIYSTKISLYEKLKISMLNQAFSGELTKDVA